MPMVSGATHFMSKDQRFSAVSNVSLTSEEATEHIIAIYID